MSYLLDTNVVSEWVSPRPDAGVARWLEEADEDQVFISVITLAELRHGVERLPVGSRRLKLESWLDADLPLRFEGRILAVDEGVADVWGRLVARRQAAGRPILVMDAFLAATAERNRMALVTRDIGDFELLGLTLINPWAA